MASISETQQQLASVERRRRPVPQLYITAAEFAREQRAKSLLLTVFLILVGRQVVAAPIRAYAPVLWYIPDFISAAGVAAVVYLALRKMITPLVVFIALFIAMAGMSLISNPLESVALSMRQIIYFILAVLTGYVGTKGRSLACKVLVAFAVVAIIGVAYDDLIGAPWQGLLFEGVLDTRAVSREWWSSGGVRRIAGFGLSSGDTAVAIACGMILLAAATSARSRIAFWVLLGPSIWAILATTQKATCGAYLLVVLVMIGMRLVDPKHYLERTSVILRSIALAALVMTIVAPFLLYGRRLGDLGLPVETLDMRTAEVWPTVIPYLFGSVRVLVGFGFGGAGQSAPAEELLILDNMFLFTTATVGVIIALAGFLLVMRAVARVQARDGDSLGGLGIICLLCINGITANIVAAGGLGSLYLGFAIGLVSKPVRGEILVATRTWTRRTGRVGEKVGA